MSKDYKDDDYIDDGFIDIDKLDEQDEQSVKEAQAFEEEQKADEEKPSSELLGQPSLTNIIGPAYWATDDVMEDEFIIRENSKTRTYGIAAYIPPNGYKQQIDTTIFQDVLALGYVDITMDIVPRKPAETMNELKKMLNIISSNIRFQEDKDQNYDIHNNLAKYSDIDNMIVQMQFDENRMYDVVISMIVYGSSHREVQNHFNYVASLLANQKMSIVPFAKRQKSGYLQTIPIGARLSTIEDCYRNVDRKSLAVMDLARNASGKFNGGIPIGVNLATPSANTEFLNVFGSRRHRPDNYNMGVIGESGSGKSTFTKIKIEREVCLLGWEHRCIDPDGEYVQLAKTLNQLNLTFTPDANFCINPVALSVTETPLENESMSDDHGNQLSLEEMELAINSGDDGRKVVKHKDGSKFVQKVNIYEMIENLAGFINIIFATHGHKGMDEGEERRYEDAIQSIIEDFGITASPDSLYTNKSGLIGTQFYDRLPKTEPTLTDLYNKLIEQNTDKDGNLDPAIQRLTDALKPYLRGGTKPLFDGQTFFGNGRDAELNDWYFVNFNLSELRGSLKQVAYYVIGQYLWNRWMANPSKMFVKKVLDCDEILKFIDDDYMFTLFEVFARGCRKQNGSITWITQELDRLSGNKKAKSLAGNSVFCMLFKTEPIHRKMLQETMDLNDGIMDILCKNPDPGEGVLISEGDALYIQTNPTKAEMKFGESNQAVKREEQRYNPDQDDFGLDY